MICFTIDGLTPCLKNLESGEIVETEVIRIKRKSFLSKFNSKTGWVVDWKDLVDENEVYALVIKGSVDVQGLIALRGESQSQTVYIQWAVVSPENNIWMYGNKKYLGVGGHLFAIAVAKSMQFGYNGVVYGDASDDDIYKYYVDEFCATPIYSHVFPRRFIIFDDAAKRLSEVYHFDWREFEM